MTTYAWIIFKVKWALGLLGWDGRGKHISGVIHITVTWLIKKSMRVCVCLQLVYVKLTNHTCCQLIASALWLLYRIALICNIRIFSCQSESGESRGEALGQLGSTILVLSWRAELALLPSIITLKLFLSHSDIFYLYVIS